MVFQLAIAVEQSVQDLQNRVGNLMIAVVDRVIPKPDDIGASLCSWTWWNGQDICCACRRQFVHSSDQICHPLFLGSLRRSLVAALFLQLLHNQLRIGRATDNIMDDILSELNISKTPRLLLLDNFETTWNPTVGTQKQVNDILCRLGQLRHVAILMTKRGTEPPCDDIKWQPKRLGALDKDFSRTIFHEMYPKSIADPDVDSLLAALGHMPFAVTLMAKLGKKSRSLVKELHGEWSEVGTEMPSHSSSPENNMNRSISLSVDRDFVQQDTDALLLLSTLCLLPAGTSRANLCWWAPGLK